MKKILLIALIPSLMATSAFAWGKKCGEKKNKSYASMIRNLTETQKTTLFKALDTNGDKKISEAEMKVSRKKLRFISRDVDGDGGLSHKEFFATKK